MPSSYGPAFAAGPAFFAGKPMRVIALKEILSHKPGEEFEIPEFEGRTLILIGYAKPVEPQSTENSAPIVPPKRQYRRRDMKSEG